MDKVSKVSSPPVGLLSLPYRDMKTHLSLPYRKRKTRIALYIRIVCLISIPSLWLITSFFATINDDIKDVQTRTNSFNRKLLAVNDTTFLENNETSPAVKAETTTIINDEISAVSDKPAQKSRNCTRAAILEFPSDGLNRNQRTHGWIAVHILIACYCFWLLAIVCDDYFVPAIGIMCFTLNMQEDVVGATFMAAATSSPELFINCVGTFITKGDIGVGTVVGSAVFNILAVPACCGLFAGQIVNLDWWPVSRDCLMYGVAVISLIGVLYDGIVMWYEGLALVLAYFFYIVVMYCNDIVATKVRTIVSNLKRKPKVRPYREVTEIAPLLNKEGQSTDKFVPTTELEKIDEENLDDFADTPWSRSASTGRIAFVARWPITLALWLTIPDCRKYPKLRLLTFFMCIVWIGLTSYFVAFLITVVDSVMGLTFLAAGTSVPEAVSSVIVTNQGHGAMGISNSIGSNTFDILLCLGLPWFVKSYFLPNVPDEKWITLNSTGLTYSAVSLLSTLFGLYISFAANKFRLDWKIGLTCTIMYIAFLIFASLVELNFFFPVNLPICDH
ncbi:sodium/potassium/calcium exchanger 3-like isoform X2 [Bradysia coprophila]|uniref:sodium/potassium/calcium exchanger 3-like isoform X2 n=1 Tax=Bradysia coprophila TaxID=38358 RepID=UPI00187D971B|nr:sodium/potassium/calcium exchanger 3-like isoform X2 [Bradysia coprophila]